ncbi:MAG: acyltransferase [Flavobacteriales bacterium]|nr:acyltransferase [Flavobacteriales bacterium]MDP4730667.1 acyltransferase [Flavobacteriales bacterium]
MVKKEYFKGLDSLRFFAALAVFFTHVELIKKFTGFGTHWIDPEERITKFTVFQSVMSKEIDPLSPLIAYSSALGVVFFFVLSGFLITYLLLKEKESNKTVQIGKFYLRRAFRIWPLYYLIFILGFFVLPNLELFAVPGQDVFFNQNFWGNLLLYAFFMPNLAFSIYTTAVPNIGQSWSIGVEEQFYLLWPLLLRKSKNVLKPILWIAGSIIALKGILLLSFPFIKLDALVVIKKFLAMSKLECMALGGLGAYVLFNKKEEVLRIIFKPVTQIMAVVVIPILIYFIPTAFEDVLHLLFSISFLVIILNVAGNEKVLLRFENRVLQYLGRISYGLYMFHVMCIVFTIHILDKYIGLDNDITTAQHILLYGISFLLTVAVSSLSYHIFEKAFIRLKDKYAQPKPTTKIAQEDV